MSAVERWDRSMHDLVVTAQGNADRILLRSASNSLASIVEGRSSATLPTVLAVIAVVLVEIRLCRLHAHICPRSGLGHDRRGLGQHRCSIRISGGALSECRSFEAQQAPARYNGRNAVSPHGLTPYSRCVSARLVSLLCPCLRGY